MYRINKCKQNNKGEIIVENIRELNDSELMNIYGGQATYVDYENNWYDNENLYLSDGCMFGAPAIII